MAQRYWTVEIHFNAFTPVRTVVWDIIERYRWTPKTLDETEDDEMKRFIAADVRILYNPPAFRMWPSTEAEIQNTEKPVKKIAVDPKST